MTGHTQSGKLSSESLFRLAGFRLMVDHDTTEVIGGQRWWDGARWTEDRTVPAPVAPPRPKKWYRLRKMTWALIIWSVLFLIWIISAGGSANCSDQAGRYQGAKQSGCEAGTGIAIVGLIVVWFMGFVVLSIIWYMSRPKT
jgi:hypothetical protein